MAKMQAKMASDKPDDGMREKMIAINRVTKWSRVVVSWVLQR